MLSHYRCCFITASLGTWQLCSFLTVVTVWRKNATMIFHRRKSYWNTEQVRFGPSDSFAKVNVFSAMTSKNLNSFDDEVQKYLFIFCNWSFLLTQVFVPKDRRFWKPEQGTSNNIFFSKTWLELWLRFRPLSPIWKTTWTTTRMTRY